MNNNSLQKKLLSYSAMAGSLIVSNQVYGQVSYFDIDPDKQFPLYTDESYFIDFNGDGLTDLTIYHNIWVSMYCDTSSTGWSCTGSTHQRIEAYGMNVNFVNNLATFGTSVASPLESGEIISEAATWGVATEVTLFNNAGEWRKWDDFWGSGSWVDFSYQFGPWQNIDNKYLGVKFEIDGLTHFGWVSLSATPTTKVAQVVKIHSYAYETTPELPIIAGFIPTCYPPNPLTPVAITGTTAKIKWEVIAGADHYELQYRQTGAASWITKTVAGVKSFRKVAGLTCDSEYEWRIRSFCSDGEVSLYSDIQTFNTSTCRLGEETIEEEPPFSVFSYGSQIYISLDEETPTNWNCKIFNVYGQLLFESQISNSETVLETELPNGIYIVTMEIAGENYAVQVALNR